MELQVRGDWTGAVLALAFVANAHQLVSERGPIAIGPSVDIVRCEAASNGAGGEHRRFEADPLLIRPVDELQWAAGRHAGIVERAHDLQGGEDTIGAVVATAAAHGVDVRGHHDRGAALPTGATPGHIAEVIDANVQPGLLQPAAKEIASSAIFG